jgi:hypothetical protein
VSRPTLSKHILLTGYQFGGSDFAKRSQQLVHFQSTSDQKRLRLAILDGLTSFDHATRELASLGRERTPIFRVRLEPRLAVSDHDKQADGN